MLLAHNLDRHINLLDYTDNTSQVNGSASGNPALMRFSTEKLDKKKPIPLIVAEKKSQS